LSSLQMMTSKQRKFVKKLAKKPWLVLLFFRIFTYEDNDYVNWNDNLVKDWCLCGHTETCCCSY
jgi:hypothetical protein